MNIVLRIVIGAVIGAGIGFALYRFVGCRTGACPLTGNPYIAMAIWGLMGAFITGGK
jgi:hypothetical protein